MTHINVHWRGQPFAPSDVLFKKLWARSKDILRLKTKHMYMQPADGMVPWDEMFNVLVHVYRTGIPYRNVRKLGFLGMDEVDVFVNYTTRFPGKLSDDSKHVESVIVHDFYPTEVESRLLDVFCRDTTWDHQCFVNLMFVQGPEGRWYGSGFSTTMYLNPKNCDRFMAPFLLRPLQGKALFESRRRKRVRLMQRLQTALLGTHRRSIAAIRTLPVDLLEMVAKEATREEMPTIAADLWNDLHTMVQTLGLLSTDKHQRERGFNELLRRVGMFE